MQAALLSQWDVNGDGSISRNELKMILQQQYQGTEEKEEDEYYASD